MVHLETLPQLTTSAQATTSMSDNEYDNLSDDIADLDGVDWDRLLSAPAPNRRTPQREPEAAAEAHIRGTGGSTPSSIYFDDESLDETAFAELDAIEQRYTQQAAGSSSRQSLGVSRLFSVRWTQPNRHPR
ncbi:hypothetical protein DFP72DRAFT_10524 [Ephemerocybe angulata]|uniref:Uncharacterized protein n=1 Tax=Ephemerocybe angulata TaxID=980116 RepID=A0A8H6IIB2_9AGAR|nr:hypothetical protein DFP72DRAFT_10524 [Tulosesus angulatus]